MKKAHKKGFTIVELAIVIVVIAILAAVLIPTFVNLVRRAYEADDLASVRNMDTLIATNSDRLDEISDEILNNEEYADYAGLVGGRPGEVDEEALRFISVYLFLKENGIDIGVMNLKATNTKSDSSIILYDGVNDCLLYCKIIETDDGYEYRISYPTGRESLRPSNVDFYEDPIEDHIHWIFTGGYDSDDYVNIFSFLDFGCVYCL